LQVRLVWKLKLEQSLLRQRIPNTELFFIITGKASSILIKHDCIGHFWMPLVFTVNLVGKLESLDFIKILSKHRLGISASKA